MASISCPSCGATLSAGIKFCAECGHQIGAKAETAATAEPPATRDQRPLIIGLLVAAVVAIVAASLFMDGDDGGSSTTSSGEVTDEAHSALLNAATAQESFLTVNAAYTTSVTDLEAEGLSLPPGHELSVVSADSTSYCMEVIDSSGTSTFYSSDTGRPTVGQCP